MRYRQCRLVRQEEKAEVTTITWLPEKFCHLGMVVTLKDSGTFTVQYVGPTFREEKDLPDPHAESKGLWKATSGPVVVGHK